VVSHLIRPREDWLDPALPWDHVVNGKGKFYVCPPFRGWDEIDDVVIHYPGADWPDMDINNDGRIDELDTIALLRSGHRMYLMGADRGYSYGYGFKIGTGGDIWEIRGYDYANAANLGDAAHGTYPPPWNNSTISIQVVVDIGAAPTLVQIAATNWLLDDMAARAGKQLGLTYHRHGQYTSCPGDPLVSVIEAGWIGFGLSTPSEPDVPTTPGGPVSESKAGTTLFIPTDCDAQFIGQTDERGVATEVWWADGRRANAHLGAGARIDDKLSLGGFNNVVLLGPLPTGDTRHNWDGSEFFRVVS
jgi:hypothetical protein